VSSETLSQSEIDLLLGGSKGGRAQAVERRLDQDVQIYDFRRPHRVSKERLRTLEAMYGRLAKSLEGWLMGRVRGQVELTLQSVEQFSFGEFTLSLSTPCCSYIFDVRDSGGQRGVVDFGSDFAFFLVDRLFGGAGGHAVPDRMLTPIERMAVRVVAERVSTLVCEIWEDHTEMELVLSGWESIPEILQAANRDDPVLVANIDVNTAGMRSLLMICLPFSVLERFFVSSGARRVNTVVGSEREREANREMTEVSLRATSVEIAARLPEFRISMADLANMKVGGVIGTGIPCTAEVEVLISEQPRYRAAPGRVGRNLAVRVMEPVPRLTEQTSSATRSDPDA
jgi:flagellar motor switch protein FliM